MCSSSNASNELLTSINESSSESESLVSRGGTGAEVGERPDMAVGKVRTTT